MTGSSGNPVFAAKPGPPHPRGRTEFGEPIQFKTIPLARIRVSRGKPRRRPGLFRAFVMYRLSLARRGALGDRAGGRSCRNEGAVTSAGISQARVATIRAAQK